MDAKTFLNNKCSAAQNELRALETEYATRMGEVRARIDMARLWMDELGAEKGAVVEPPPVKMEVVESKIVVVEPVVEAVDPISEQLAEMKVSNQNNEVVLDRAQVEHQIRQPAQQEEVVKRTSDNWVSARDLRPNIRQAS